MTDANRFDHGNYQFDRLVDGELSPAEYHNLLAALDDEPGGWRQCALAFLEAQALKRGLSALVGEPEQASVERTAEIPRQRSQSSPRRQQISFRSILAAAAGILIAFGLGLAARTIWTTTPHDGPADVIANSHDRSGQSGIDIAPPNDAEVVDANKTPAEDAMAGGDRRPMGNVTLVVEDEGADPRSLEVPVYHLDQVGDDFWAGERSALSPEMARLIRLSGHRLQRAQTYMPFTLSDGQQVVVPVEEIEITPVSLPPF